MPAHASPRRVLDQECLAEIFRGNLCNSGRSRTNVIKFRRCGFRGRYAVVLKRVAPPKLNYPPLCRNTPHLNVAPGHRSEQRDQIVLFLLTQEIRAEPESVR